MIPLPPLPKKKIVNRLLFWRAALPFRKIKQILKSERPGYTKKKGKRTTISQRVGFTIRRINFHGASGIRFFPMKFGVLKIVRATSVVLQRGVSMYITELVANSWL